MSQQDHQAVNLSPFTRHPTMANTSRPQPFQQGDYLTDRRQLYRVLEVVPAKFKKRAAILEDCRTLDATLFLPREHQAHATAAGSAGSRGKHPVTWPPQKRCAAALQTRSQPKCAEPKVGRRPSRVQPWTIPPTQRGSRTNRCARRMTVDPPSRAAPPSAAGGAGPITRTG